MMTICNSFQYEYKNLIYISIILQRWISLYYLFSSSASVDTNENVHSNQQYLKPSFITTQHLSDSAETKGFGTLISHRRSSIRTSSCEQKQFHCNTRCKNDSINESCSVPFGQYDTLTLNDIVRNQYAELPYPAVSPEALKAEKMYYDNKVWTVKAHGELRSYPMRISFGTTLEAINHFLFEGKNNFRSQFRSLVAGGGTDGGAPFMAEQLNHTNAEIVYLDFSHLSMKIAQYRAKCRGWLKIVWIIDWIESSSRLGLGKFDLVTSTGVLHHLKNPQLGLSTISDLQTKNGGADIMVYATYGRTPVYWIQKLMHIFNGKNPMIDNELQNTKHILKVLPKQHLFNFISGDHVNMGDVGIYDLLLHKRDVSYTSIQVFEWLQKSGYNVVSTSSPDNSISISLKGLIKESQFFEKISRLDLPVQYEIGEIIRGHVTKQQLYVSKTHDSKTKLNDLNNTLIFTFGSPTGFQTVIKNNLNRRHIRDKTFVFATIARAPSSKDQESTNPTMKPRNNMPLPFPPVMGNLVWPLSEFNTFILENITRKPIKPKSIQDMIIQFTNKSNSNITIVEGETLFKELYSYIEDSKMFFLKDKSIPTFPLTCCSVNWYHISDIDL